MKNRTQDLSVPFESRETNWRTQGKATIPSSMYLVSSPELQNLRHALFRGVVPADFQSKLERLSGTGLGHHFIEQNSRVFIALLLAAQTGEFRGSTPAERERLLRALAYVRKDDDAIPDPRPDGFADDLQEVRAACAELAPLLAAFKRWRLEHQVPGFWMNPRPANTDGYR